VDQAGSADWKLTEPLRVRTGDSPVFVPAHESVALDAGGHPIMVNVGILEADTKVTERAVLHVRMNHYFLPSPYYFVEVVHSAGTNLYRTYPDTTNYSVSATVILSNGFNIVRAPGMHPLLQKTILVIGNDSDGDGLTDGDEADLGTDPHHPDTDGDGLNDALEVLYGSDPLKPDSDGDGLLDGQEVALGTNPNNQDTDSDGIWDGAELLLGSDPLSPFSTPPSIPPGFLASCSSGPNGGGYLTLIDPATGNVSLLGRPNNGDRFGLAYDSLPTLYLSRMADFASHSPLQNLTTPVGYYGAPGGVLLNVVTLTYNPTNDFFYGVEAGPAPGYGPTGQLVEIDPVNGAGRRLAIAGTNLIRSLLCTSNGIFYAAVAGAAASDRFVTLDPLTGAVTQEIGPIGYAPITGLAITTNGIIYGAQPLSSSVSRLLTIDPATGAGTPLSTVNRGLAGLALPSLKKVSALVSINRFSTGDGNGPSLQPVISANGKAVIFASRATDLTPLPDQNNILDLYWRDLESGETRLVTIDSAKSAAAFNVAPQYTSPFHLQRTLLSADGRYVVFVSDQTNLPTAIPSLGLDTYWHDVQSTNTVRLTDGTALAGYNATDPALSTDGRWVVFSAQGGLWKRGILGGGLSLVSVNRFGTPTTGGAVPVLSPDGRYVLFVGVDPDLAANPDANLAWDLYRRDTVAGTTVLVSMDRSGDAAGLGEPPTPTYDILYAMTPDGRYVVFDTPGTNLTAIPDDNAARDVFMRDMQSGVTKLVSVNFAGTAAGKGYRDGVGSSGASISADGRYVAFASAATNLINLPLAGNISDVYVRDMWSNTTVLVSINHAGTNRGNGNSLTPIISADGRRVCFSSAARDLVDPPIPLGLTANNLFVRDLVARTTTLLSVNSRGTTAAGSQTGSVWSPGFSLSTNGVVAFASGATNLVRVPRSNPTSDVFFRRLDP
jgi:Tol biopolymer transport system component